MVDMTLNNL